LAELLGGLALAAPWKELSLLSIMIPNLSRPVLYLCAFCTRRGWNWSSAIFVVILLILLKISSSILSMSSGCSFLPSLKNPYTTLRMSLVV